MVRCSEKNSVHFKMDWFQLKKMVLQNNFKKSIRKCSRMLKSDMVSTKSTHSEVIDSAEIPGPRVFCNKCLSALCVIRLYVSSYKFRHPNGGQVLLGLNVRVAKRPNTTLLNAFGWFYCNNSIRI